MVEWDLNLSTAQSAPVPMVGVAPAGSFRGCLSFYSHLFAEMLVGFKGFSFTSAIQGNAKFLFNNWGLHEVKIWLFYFNNFLFLYVATLQCSSYVFQGTREGGNGSYLHVSLKKKKKLFMQV